MWVGSGFFLKPVKRHSDSFLPAIFYSHYLQSDTHLLTPLLGENVRVSAFASCVNVSMQMGGLRGNAPP